MTFEKWESMGTEEEGREMNLLCVCICRSRKKIRVSYFM